MQLDKVTTLEGSDCSNKSNYKILFFVNDMGFFVSHRLSVAKAAVLAGYGVSVACPHDKKVGLLEKHSIRHIPISLTRGNGSIYQDILAIKRIYSIFQQENPDLIHLITSKPIIVGGVISRLLNIPVVAAVSGLGHIFIGKSIKLGFLRKIVMLGYRFALNRRNAWAIFQNNENRDLFVASRVLGEPPTMIRGMGVDLAKFNPSLPQNKVPEILLPCRMLYTKGVSEFVEAAKILKKKDIIANFTLMGDPDQANPASISLSTLETWNSEGFVKWRSHSDTIEIAMHDADIIVLPSYNEGFPKTLIDAAAAGRPAVTTDVTGCRDAIIDGTTGLLSQPRNAQSLANNIEILINNPSLRVDMGYAARKHAEHNFSIERIVENHLNLYTIVINKSQKKKKT